jgi:hypothetical protein
MAVFQHLLERWGFVKLERYGLVRTPDDRIISTRPVALDDGAGGRIVGWRDNDLAMAELAPWQPEHGHVQAPAQRHVQFPVRPPVPPPAIAPARVVALPPAIPQPSGPAQVPGPAAPRAMMPAAVAPEAAVDEDDWEWTIALARARAEAEETPTAPVPSPQAHPGSIPPSTATLPAAPTATSAKMATSVPAVAPSAPATVIPVPQLPSILHPGRTARFEPVVRTTVTAVPPAPRSRFAKGTETIGSDTEQIAAVTTDDTEQGFAIGDRTQPGIGMPLAARAVALPSIKRRDERRG